MPISIELAIIVALILANGFFAAAEIAILTVRRGRLEQMENRSARVALELAASPQRFLPTVQLGMTLVSTLASVFSGATLVRYLAEKLRTIPEPFISKNNETIALGSVVLCITFLALVFGELVPKQLALANAEGFARLVALPLRGLQIIARPIVWLMEMSTGAVLRVFARSRKDDSTVSIEDIEHLIRTGTRQGVLDQAEQMVARRALRLGDRTVREIMHPRIEIDALDVETPAEEVIGAVAMAGFSRVPVHEGDLDHIIGFIYTKDLLLRQHMGWPIELRKLVRPALLVPESLHIDKLLERFREKRTQMAIVLDEFGGTEGLVTMEDVLEELVGEIHDEHRVERQQEMVRREDGSWLIDGSMNLHDLFEKIDHESYRELVPQDVSTVAGLVLFVMGQIPKKGDRATWQKLSIEVIALDGRRLDRVAITVGR